MVLLLLFHRIVRRRGHHFNLLLPAQLFLRQQPIVVVSLIAFTLLLAQEGPSC